MVVAGAHLQHIASSFSALSRLMLAGSELY